MTIPAVVVFCICGCVLCLVLRQYEKSQSVLLAIAICCTVLGAAMPQVSDIVRTATAFFSQSGMEPSYFVLLCKALGISYLTQLGMDFCRDCGENAVCSAVEICGRICLVMLSLPLFTALAETVLEVIG